MFPEFESIVAILGATAGSSLSYLLPALFAGLGVNMLSHILVGHLRDAETRFDQEQGNLRRNSSP